MDAAADNDAPPVTRPEARRGVYFGWRVVAALFLCSTPLLGISIYAFIMFAAPLAEQFGWSAAQTGSLVSAMWVVGPLALLTAPVIERFGAWRLVAVGMVLQVVVLVALGSVNAFWQLYLLRTVMGVGKIALMTAVPVIIARWFNLRFATAMAIVWAGGGAGGIVIAPLTQFLTTTVGWRSAALILAAALALCGMIAALLARGPASPAQAGLAQDGGALSPAGPDEDAYGGQTHERGWRAALQSMNWWSLTMMCVAVIGAGMTSIALQSQEPALFEHAGMSAATAALMLSVTAAAALLGSIFVGWLLDRFHVAWSVATVATAFFLGLLAFATLSETPSIALGVLAAAGAGYGLGAGEVVWIALFKRQFGVAAFPTTYGIFYFSIQMGFATGGFVGGWGIDNLGPHGLLILCAATFLPVVVFSLWRPDARKAVLPSRA